MTKCTVLVAVLGLLLCDLAFGQTRYCQSVAGHVAAIDKESLDLGLSLIGDKDYAAFSKLMAQGRATILKGGDRVHLVSPGFLTTTFRLPGNPTVLWTVAEGIRCR